MKKQYSQIKFKEFTTQSLIELKARKNKEKEILLFEYDDKLVHQYKECASMENLSKLPTPKFPLEELRSGNNLPKALKENFPENLIGKPLEDIDEFYKQDYVSLFKTIYLKIILIIILRKGFLNNRQK